MTYSTKRKSRLRSGLRSVLPPVVGVIFLLAVWELAVAWYGPKPQILPAPSRVFTQMTSHQNWPNLMKHTRATIEVTILGFACSLVVSWLVAIFVDFCDPVRKAITPLLVASQTIPTIAIAPLMITWFGFGFLPKILLVILVTFFPVALGLIEGFRATPIGKTDLLASMGASKWQQFCYVRLPQAVPAFFTSLRIAVTYAVGGAIFSEYAGSKQGLGVYMALMKNSFRTDLVLAAVAVTAIVSIIFFGVTVVVEHIVAPWSVQMRKSGGRRP